MKIKNSFINTSHFIQKTLLAASLMFVTVHAINAEENFSVFEPMDVFDLEWASDPRVSPDGKTIVYVRKSNDIMKDRERSNLWQVSTDGSDHRPLYSGLNSIKSPRWSPNGEKLAFISNDTGSQQIHVRWFDSGDTAVISQLQASPSNLSWSPDGKWLAFTMNVKAPTKSIAEPRTKPEGATWAKKPITVTTTRYQYDGQGIVEPAYRHVFIVPADGGTSRQLTEGNFNHYGSLAWSPNSDQVFFSAYRSDDWELVSDEADIYSVNISTKKLKQITNQSGAERSPVISPNGRLIAFIKEERRPLAYTPDQIAIMDLNGENIRILSEALDGDASNLLWAGNSQALYYTYDERGIRKIGQATIKGSLRPVIKGVGGTTIGRPYLSGGFHANNGTLAFTHGTSDRPANIAIIQDDQAQILTRLNEDLLGHRRLGSVKEITYKSSFDGQEIQGWYITPPDFDPSKKYPLILEIHGGPHLAYGPYFSAELQIMAAAGYVVFYNNYRGSLSYGEDFALLLQYKYSSKEDFADHMSGIDKLIDLGFIDDENLFIAGGSAGGIATAYAVGLTDRFNAAVAAKPVINWLSKPLTADSMVGQIYHQFPGPPWEHVDHYWERSPLSLMGNVITPTMLITGENDRRTPISETEQFYQALRLRGVDSAMVRLPDTSHGIASRPSRLISKVDHILAWFERYKTDKDKK
ncbi:MAG: S9 family peptidase [Gammaproteobacteria bacterium]|jgi:dipeptidyl aminopeptidase/acylaminoacyl peptidase